jgi:hypothetical protein
MQSRQGKKKSRNELHQLIKLTEKHAGRLKQYGIDLQKIYALLRKQIIHKNDFKKQKTLLRRDTFSVIIDDLIQLSDFTFSLEARLMLWYSVFGLLPYTFPEKDQDVVFNIYPRYDYACIISVAYVLGGYQNKLLKKNIMIKALKGERSTPGMKKLFKDLLATPYRNKFVVRTKKFLDEIRSIHKDTKQEDLRSLQQIEEDFNFGFSWIGFHLPQK